MFLCLILDLSSCYFPPSSTCSISHFHLPQLSSLLLAQIFVSLIILPIFPHYHSFSFNTISPFFSFLSFSPFFSPCYTPNFSCHSFSFISILLFLLSLILFKLSFSPSIFLLILAIFPSLPYFFFHLHLDFFFYPSCSNFIPSFSYFLYTTETEFKKKN